MVRRLIVIFAIVFVTVFLTTWWRTPIAPIRNSIVYVGSPTVIVSWEPNRSQYIILTIPSDMRVEALHGYGSYSLASLWKLDTLEKRHGSLFLPTIVENFAVPTQWYSVHDQVVGITNEEVVQFVTNQFSFLALAKSIVFRSSSLTPVDMVRIWMATRAIDARSARVFDFRSRSIGSNVSVPDGSIAIQFDPKMYDGILSNMLESVELRKESIRLAIYNTTSMLGIGSRVARVLEHIGGYVVFVGNDDVLYDGLCELKGSKERLQSITVSVIHSLYDCSLSETTESMRGDVLLRLGKLFEKRYLPF